MFCRTCIDIVLDVGLSLHSTRSLAEQLMETPQVATMFDQICEALAFSGQGQYTLFFMSCACDGHLNLCLSTSDSKQVLQYTKGNLNQTPRCAVQPI